MLSEHETPDSVKNAPNGLYGDVDLFMKSYEAGEQAAAWNRLVAENALSDEDKLAWILFVSRGGN